MERLSEENLPSDPIELFRRAYGEAEAHPSIRLHNACCLSTVDPDGWPEGRIVLLKDFGPDGFSFFTNMRSAKGRSLAANPRAAMTFYWEEINIQIRIQGRVLRVEDSEADAYFVTRPRGSALSAWASLQSEPLESRALMEERMAEFERKYEGRAVPRPPYWTGCRVKPRRIEFWQDREDRLHDRFLYTRLEHGGWITTRLYP